MRDLSFEVIDKKKRLKHGCLPSVLGEIRIGTFNTKDL